MAKQSAFQIFNQKLKEKIGVAEQVTTYPEEPELSTKLEVMTNQIKKITREIHKQEKTTSTLLEAGAELSDSLVDGGVSFREDPLRYMLAGSLDKVAEVQRHVDDLRSKLGKQIVSEVYEPLDNVIEVDVKEAKMQKSKFEKTRVELDAGISKLNGLGKKAKEEKVKEVELEVDELRKNFSQVGMETVDKLQDTIALSEDEMLGSLVHYMELYRDFFVNSNRFMVTLIPEIEEYKNYIETQRDQLHGSAIAKQIEAAAAAAPPEKKFGTLKLKNLKSSFGIGDKKKVDKGTPASEIFAKPENDPFGKDIEQVANKDGSDVPAIVDKAVEYIENKGLQEEGIFRISASKKEVDQLKGEIAQTADETTSSPEVVAEKKPDESSSSSEEKKSHKEELEKEKDKDGKKDPVRQRSAGSLMIKKTSLEDLRQARRLERAHTISVGIADPSHPINAQPLTDTPSKKGEKSVEEPHEEGAKKKPHAATSPRFKNFIKKLSFRADKKDKIEKKDDKGEVSVEAKLEKDDKKHEKKDKEKKVDHDQKKLEKEKKDEEKRLEKERKELEKKKKKEVEAAEKEAKKKDKKKKDESTPPESKSSEDHKKEVKKSAKDKDKKEESSSSESVVKYEYKPVDAHMSISLPAGSTPEAAVAVAVPAAEVEHKSGEEKKTEVEVKVETETTKSVEEKKPEVQVETETKNRSRSSSSSSSKAEKAHEPVVEVPATEVKVEPKEPEVHVEIKAEPVHEVKETTEVAVQEPQSPKQSEAKVEVESPKTKSPLTMSGEDEDKEKKKREKEEKARKEKEESAKKKAEKEAKKKEKEEKEREEKERKKAEKESKKKLAEKEKEKPEKEPKKKEKKAEAGANEEESSSSSEEKEKKGKKSPKWLQKLKPKTPRKKDDVEKTSPRDDNTGDLVLNRKKKAVVVETNDLESSINSPRPQLTESTSEKSQAPTSTSASELKLKLESTEKTRAENQTHIEEQTRSVLSSVGSKLDELENQLNTLDLSISPRASATIPAEASPRDPDTPASREKLGNELQNLEAMLNNIPEQVQPEVKTETEVAPVTPVVETSVNVSASAPEQHVDEKPKETKDDHSSSPSS